MSIYSEHENSLIVSEEDLAKKDLWLDANGHRMFEYDRIKRLELEMNNTCFVYCGGCERTFNKKIEDIGKRIITLDNIKKFFPPEFCAQLHYFLSCGNYGDPTAHPDTLEILKWFRDNGTKAIGFSTNGGSRSPEWWADVARVINGEGGSKDNIQNYYGGRVTFSIDGLWDTNHIYKIGVKWERLMENAKAFIDAGGRARWQFIVMNHNEHQIEQAREFAKEMGFSEFIEKVSFRYSTLRVSRKHAEKLAQDAEYAMLAERQGELDQLRGKIMPPTRFQENFLVSKGTERNGGLVESPIGISTNAENRHPYRERVSKIHSGNKKSEEWWKEKKNIRCQNVSEPQLYITFDGKVWPCNWLGGIEYYAENSKFWPLPQHREHDLPLDFNDLHKYVDQPNPLKAVLEHPFYTHLLEEDWAKSAELQPNKCKQMCHTQLGKGLFEAMRRNEVNLKTGEYKDVAEIHNIHPNGIPIKQGGTGIGPGSVVPAEGSFNDFAEFHEKDDEFGDDD
jgi:MoaA/NifB/PqqE/SkfB family radical SAM enzyme